MNRYAIMGFWLSWFLKRMKDSVFLLIKLSTSFLCRRRCHLLAHLLEEILDSKKFKLNGELRSSSCNSLLSDLTLALQAAKRLVVAANGFDDSKISFETQRLPLYY
ncbi:hypothetical protein ACS0TY_000102 [Phlomoides rotata]